MPGEHSEILIIGGGIAGLSAAAALAEHRPVTVLEAEESIGYHSSGRSATMLHYALGDRLVRALTLASRGFFEAPPEGFTEAPLAHRVPVLIYARENEKDELDELEAEIAPFATLARLGVEGIRELCPLLRFGPGGAEHGLADREGLRLDPHALLQGFDRRLRCLGGSIVTGARVAGIERTDSGWQIDTERGGRFTCDILINAAGAWADVVAQLSGVAPLGLKPMRRTIITFDPPPGTSVAGLPFAKTVGDELYFAPESGRLFASPMDEVSTDPCDAQPEEYEVALAAHRIEERTTMQVTRVLHRWAGLRTFAPDRRPVAGFAADAPGFFWLVGQGGFGLQTSPMMAAVTASLITGAPWPGNDATADELSPLRFANRAVGRHRPSDCRPVRTIAAA